MVPSAPYAALMPRLDAAVHHGGAGTVAHCLRGATPMMVCPVLHPVGDQLFWGRRAEAAGVGAPPIPAKKLDAEGLIAGVERMLGDEAMRERADELAAEIRAEDGVGLAVAAIEAERAPAS